MKKFLLVFFILYVHNLLAQIVVIKDGFSNSIIQNATLSYKSNGVTSGKNGEANISIFNHDNIIKISHVSYQTIEIKKENIDSIVYLKQKTTVLPTVVFSEEVNVPKYEKHSIFKIKPVGVSKLQSSISGLLSSESSVVVQESQSGGGSPNYRGMEANRLLLIVDGIPLNNAIYRSGHLQNSATINPFFIKSISLLSGPASAAYGNGAMGGALVFNTITTSKINRFLFQQQFETSSNAVVASFKANYYKNNVLHVTALSLKSADNLRMGANRLHGYKFWGNEITSNNRQLYSNYTKIDFIHKSSCEINSHNKIQLNTQYATSSNIARFDKMNDIIDEMPKYKNWYYGPQVRFFQSIEYTAKYRSLAFDNLITTLAFQNLKESRHISPLGDTLLNNRSEDVKIYDYTTNFSKKIHNISLNYGIGLRDQKIKSLANLRGTNGEAFYNTTRYPNEGSNVQDIFAHTQVNIPIKKNTDLYVGGRWNYRQLEARFNSQKFNFDNIQNNNAAFVGSILISYRPISKIIMNTSYYSGFRNPNIDDIGKVFSKDDINVVVPNSKLEPEYANNLEFSLNFLLEKWTINTQLFNTQISNAIKREYGSLNGVDSMLYDGQMMRVQMNKNIESATINGASFSASFKATKNFLMRSRLNYLIGKTNDNRPLAHIPPFNCKIAFNYKFKKHILDFYINYNGWKLAKDYDDAGVDNLEEATIDGNPSWHTINLVYAKKIEANLSYSIAIKNILDAHYKTFGSGISASGRNFILSLRAHF